MCSPADEWHKQRVPQHAAPPEPRPPDSAAKDARRGNEVKQYETALGKVRRGAHARTHGHAQAQAHTHTGRRVCAHVCTHACGHARAHTAHAPACAQTRTCGHAHVHTAHAPTCTHVSTHECTRHTLPCVHMQMRMHTRGRTRRTCTYVHTLLQAYPSPRPGRRVDMAQPHAPPRRGGPPERGPSSASETKPGREPRPST